MKNKKIENFDGIDRDIIRILSLKSPLNSSDIAKCLGLSRFATMYRLNKLLLIGILKNQDPGIINSPRTKNWSIDIET